MPLVENERVKLTAGALNTVATTSFGLGVLAPLAASFYSLKADHLSVHWLVIGVGFWTTAAFYMHRQARRVLGGLKE